MTRRGGQESGRSDLVRSIHLEDRHPVRSLDVKLAPLTVIIGRNDSGKTRLIDAIGDVLDPFVPDGGRPGWWVPTEDVENLVRSRMDLPDGPMRIRGPQNGRSFTIEVGSTSRVADLSLAHHLSSPMGEVVRLDLGSAVGRDDDGGIEFLAAVVEDSLAAGWQSRGDPNDHTDLRHLTDIDGRVHRWVAPALELLAAEAFELIPPPLRDRYSALRIELIDDPSSGEQCSIELVGENSTCPSSRLSSGLRGWVAMSIREATRRLRLCDTEIDGDGVRLRRRPPDRSLYLVDEPERHLHPVAAASVARWLYALADHSRGTTVVVATHSPAFLELASYDHVKVIMCMRDDLPDDDIDASVTHLRTWHAPEISRIGDHARALGVTLADIFLTGTIPVILEGRLDLEYFQTVWPLVCGNTSQAEGVRLFEAGGVSLIGDMINEVIAGVYPEGTPIVVITDNPDLDYPNAGAITELPDGTIPGLRVMSHDRFDIWAMIPERLLYKDRQVKRRTKWKVIEAKRRAMVDAFVASDGSVKPTLPGKQAMLTRGMVNDWRTFLGRLTPKDVPAGIVEIVTTINAIAGQFR